MRNVQLQDSVIRRLEIAGEAAGRVSVQFRESKEWRLFVNASIEADA